jgi:hypothetical protein
MAKATACLLDDRRIEIAEALRFRQAETNGATVPMYRVRQAGPGT